MEGIEAFANTTSGNEMFGIHQFSPSANATPDESGVFGMICFEGTFASLKEAEDAAKQLAGSTSTSRFDQLLVAETGVFKPLTRNACYTGKVQQVADGQHETDNNNSMSQIDHCRSGDTTRIPSSTLVKGEKPEYLAESVHEDGSGESLQIVGSDGRFDATPSFTPVDKELEDSKNRIVGTRQEKEAQMKSERAELKHLLTVGPPEEAQKLTTAWHRVLLSIDNAAQKGKMTAKDTNRRAAVYSAVLDRYMLARMRRATALAKMHNVQQQQEEAMQADAAVSAEIVAAHTHHPLLQKIWIVTYTRALANAHIVLKEDDPWSMLRHITRREWDEAPPDVQHTLLENQASLRLSEQQGVMWKHEQRHKHLGTAYNDNGSEYTAETASVYDDDGSADEN